MAWYLVKHTEKYKFTLN